MRHFVKFIRVVLILSLIGSFWGTAYAGKTKKSGIVLGFSNASLSDSWRKFMLANFWAEIAKHPEIAKVHYTNARDRAYQQRKDIDNLLKKK
ncbi:MAG: ABC-type sugar transport system substrate-binding protein, partial [bacterium]